MSANRHAASMLVALSIGAGACGHAAAPRSTRAAAASVPATRSLGPALVREVAVPSHPPIVDLVLASGSTQRGVRYATDFRVRSATTTQAPRWPVPWPAPVATRAGAATIVLHSTSLPDDVTVKSWRKLVSDGHRVPDIHFAEPIYECRRFDAPTCDFTRRAGDLRLPLPARALPGPFLAISLQWHIPLDQRLSGSLASDTATATWLFRVGASSS